MFVKLGENVRYLTPYPCVEALKVKILSWASCSIFFQPFLVVNSLIVQSFPALMPWRGNYQVDNSGLEVRRPEI